MKSTDYKAIQDMMIRYEGYLQCRRFDLICDHLLSRNEDMTYERSDLESPVHGKENILLFFEEASGKIEENGGFYRCDFSNSGTVSFSQDEKSAKGIWLTVGFICERESHTDASLYRYYKVFGQRCVDFVLEEGCWRMKNISWKEMMRLGPYLYDNAKATGWISLKDRRWELPPDEHTPVWERRSK